MVRDIDDRTSACRSCSYWDSSAPGLPQGNGYCGYSSVPAWVHKHLTPRDDHRIMSSDEGLDCWQHTQRVIDHPDGLTTEQRLHRLSVFKGQSSSQGKTEER